MKIFSQPTQIPVIQRTPWTTGSIGCLCANVFGVNMWAWAPSYCILFALWLLADLVLYAYVNVRACAFQKYLFSIKDIKNRGSQMCSLHLQCCCGMGRKLTPPQGHLILAQFHWPPSFYDVILFVFISLCCYWGNGQMSPKIIGQYRLTCVAKHKCATTYPILCLCSVWLGCFCWIWNGPIVVSNSICSLSHSKEWTAADEVRIMPMNCGGKELGEDEGWEWGSF
jgi:hypothetical protein